MWGISILSRYQLIVCEFLLVCYFSACPLQVITICYLIASFDVILFFGWTSCYMKVIFGLMYFSRYGLLEGIEECLTIERWTSRLASLRFISLLKPMVLYCLLKSSSVVVWGLRHNNPVNCELWCVACCNTLPGKWRFQYSKENILLETFCSI